MYELVSLERNEVVNVFDSIAYNGIESKTCYYIITDKPKFEFYTRLNGHTEFIEFYHKLPRKDREKLLATIFNVQANGLIVARKMKWIKKINRNIFELRSKVGNNIQRGLYFHVENQVFLVTHGFSKKTDKTPLSQIKHAEELRDEYLRRSKHDEH